MIGADFRSFATLNVGDVLSGRMTITESHIVLASGIFGDFAPLHVDEEFAKTTRFGGRIAHGTLITGVMAGVLSKSLGANALGYLEQTVRFVAPVFPGETVTTTWTILEKIEKAKLGGGIVKLAGDCSNQDGVSVVTGEAALIVGY